MAIIVERTDTFEEWRLKTNLISLTADATSNIGNLQQLVTATKSNIVAATPANANTGTGMMATSAQVQMGAMGLSAVGGGNITNIYNSNGQQVSPIGNTLSAGTPSGNAGLGWLALVRR